MVIPLWLAATMVCYKQSSFGKAAKVILFLILLTVGLTIVGGIAVAVVMLIFDSGLLLLVLMVALFILSFYLYLRILAGVYDISMLRALGVWAVSTLLVFVANVALALFTGPLQFMDDETGMEFADFMELLRGGNGSNLHEMGAWELIEDSPSTAPDPMEEMEGRYQELLQAREELDFSDPDAVMEYNRDVAEYEAALEAARDAQSVR